MRVRPAEDEIGGRADRSAEEVHIGENAGAEHAYKDGPAAVGEKAASQRERGQCVRGEIHGSHYLIARGPSEKQWLGVWRRDRQNQSLHDSRLRGVHIAGDQ